MHYAVQFRTMDRDPSLLQQSIVVCLDNVKSNQMLAFLYPFTTRNILTSTLSLCLISTLK